MSICLATPTIAPPAPARPSNRYGIRAPRGGCTVAGKFYRGGQFCLPYDPANPHGVRMAAPAPSPRPALDITTTDGTITVADPMTGDVDLYWVRTETRGTFAGRRLVAVLVGDEPEYARSWRDFGFVDGFGVHVWGRFAGRPEVVGDLGHVAKLTESARLSALGLEYRVNVNR